MARLMIAGLVLGGGLYLGACIALFFWQRALIYHPTAAAREVDTLSIDLGDVALRVPARALDGESAVLYFGGNAEDASQTLPLLAAAFPGVSVYAPHYRGFGGSPGQPSERAIVDDARRLYDWVQARHPRVLVIGRSLGSGVAAHLASERSVAGLVLVTPYYSLQELAASRFPWFPVAWLIQDRFETWRYVPGIRVPTLLVAAEFDEVVPTESTARLAAAFPAGRAELVTLAGVGHNTISSSPRYLPMLRRELR